MEIHGTAKNYRNPTAVDKYTGVAKTGTAVDADGRSGKKLTELETANAALDCIHLDAGDYDKWQKIAMGYKAAAGNDGAEYFNAWNLQQPNNRGARDLKDYLQMKTDGGITVATLIQIAKGYGYQPEGYTTTPHPVKNTEPTAEAIETAPQWNRYKQGDKTFCSTILKAAPERRSEQRRAFITTLFKDGDQIAVAKRRCVGTKIFTRAELLQWATTTDENATPTPTEPIDLRGLQDAPDGTKGGLYICANCTNGEGRNDANIIQYAQTLIETDDANLNTDAQIDILEKSGIPILTLTKSGGKSVHAVTYVGAGADRNLYNERVEYLHRYLKERHGFIADHAATNPARLTRLAGYYRRNADGSRGETQELIATGTATEKDPWESFYEQAEALKTTAPPTPLTELSLDELTSLKETATPEEVTAIDKNIKELEKERELADKATPNSEKLDAEINYYSHNPALKTELASLDNLLNGGIFGDLYVLGGCSGMGKTTLALQIATALARKGCHVFFLTYEQSEASLTAKIVAQLGAEITLQLDGRAGLYQPTDLTPEDLKTDEGETPIIDPATRARKAPPTREILPNAKKYFNAEECETYKNACKALDSIKSLHIIEADGTYTAQEIASKVKKWGRIFGYNNCVVFIDYLQIIPAAAGLTDKQATDNAVRQLHEISRSHRVPIFAMSSLNRESYKGETARAAEVTLASFKESGGIEYSVDVALGLQADGDNDQERKNRLALLHGTGSIFLRVTLLKNRRGGKLGEYATLEFFPEYDFFVTANNEKEPTTAEEEIEF